MSSSRAKGLIAMPSKQDNLDIIYTSLSKTPLGARNEHFFQITFWLQKYTLSSAKSIAVKR